MTRTHKSTKVPAALIGEWLTIKDALLALGVSERTFYRMKENKLFRLKKHGVRTLVSKKDIDTYVRNLPSL